MANGENSGRYAGYGIPDFICDPFFQDWIIHPDGGSAAFWEAWMVEYPEKAKIIEEARLLLRCMYFREYFPDESRVQQSLAAAKARIGEMEQARIGEKGRLGVDEKKRVDERKRVDEMEQERIDEIDRERIVPMRGTWDGGEEGEIRRGARIRRMVWAAVVAGIVIVAGIDYLVSGGWHVQRSLATNYGEIQTLYLPDSSKIVLNAHSTVRYDKNWKPGQARELWLDGEAYFDVRSVAASTFLVHTKDLTVEVLGTAFDIRDRRGKTEIVLASGKIRVRFPEGAHRDVVMAPGDKIVYDPAKAALGHTETAPENYTSWKDKKLTAATVGEIIEYLEDNYNKTIVLEDNTLAKRRIGGVILLDNLDDALFALSTVLNVNIIQHQDTLILKPR